MPCHHYYAATLGGEAVFSLDAASVVFGRGALAELGSHGKSLGMRRVAVFTDRRVGALAHVATALASLRRHGLDPALFDGVEVEPTDGSFLEAARFAREGSFDGYVSVGGGSVIDTCKAAALYATYPAEFSAYVSRPLGEGRVVPGPLPPHVACPTTCGTGSECTGIAVFDDRARRTKTGIVSRRLRPTLAVIDPDTVDTLPPMVIAASGFDVLCHALESYTARPYTARPKASEASARPMSQGANPWSDLGALEALRLGGSNLVAAVTDREAQSAREKLLWAATLAGIAFGNAGVHLPHAMAYSIAGLVRAFRAPDYPPEHPLVPHGISVVLGAPGAFSFTAEACPDRHLHAAALLGEDTRGATAADAGALLARALGRLMRATGVPLGLGAVGYDARDLDALTAGAIVQTRLLDNAPREVTTEALRGVFEGALADVR